MLDLSQKILPNIFGVESIINEIANVHSRIVCGFIMSEAGLPIIQ